jgi:hypothetical protein
MLRNDRLFLIVDKPLTRIFPNLHEDNDNYIITQNSLNSNAFVKNKKNISTNKNYILNETFGIASN